MTSVPAPQRVLGLAGLVPFWAPLVLCLGWSVTPSLIGWAAALLSGTAALTVLALGFAVAAVVDLVTLSRHPGASWYRDLRIVLSAAAVLALLVSLLITANPKA